MEKYYTLIETCVTAEEKNTAIEKSENVLRNNQQDVEYEASVVLNADNKHKAYLQYLSRWIFEHYEDEYEGCSPVGFEEWLENENENVDANYQPDWRLDAAGWYIDENDRLVISDSAAAFNFKVGRVIIIEFLDNLGDRQNIGRYKVVDNNNYEITCEKDEDIPCLILEEDDYLCGDIGEIRINKQVFDDFIEHSYIKIRFIEDNEDNNIYTYVMKSEDDEFITCEFIG